LNVLDVRLLFHHIRLFNFFKFLIDLDISSDWLIKLMIFDLDISSAVIGWLNWWFFTYISRLLWLVD